MPTRFFALVALVVTLLGPATVGATGTCPPARRAGPPAPARPLSNGNRNQPPGPAARLAGPAVPVVVAPTGSVPAATVPVTISGSVTDANGLPLAGATIWVVGHLRQMAVTNADGDFRLTLPAQTPVQLSYAAAGYQGEVVVLPRPSRLTMPAISLLAAGAR